MKKTAFTLVFLCCATVLTSSCTKKNIDRFNPDKHDKIDRYLDLNREDYKKMAEPKRDANGEIIPDISYSGNSGPPIPEIAPILAAPRPPKIGESQLVSIAVTDDVPLKDVILELAKLADVDVEMDSNIEGGVNFIAKEKPFNEVVDRLADLAGLRYSMKKGVLRVELDKPYIKSYSLDFLNMDRSNESTVSLATNVLSGGGGGGGDSGGSSGGSSSGGGGGGGSGLSTGSTSSVESKTESDFWKQLDEGVKQILSYKQQKRTSQSTNNIAQDQDLGALLSSTSSAGTAAPASPGTTTGTPAAPASPGAPAAVGAAASGSGGSGQGIEGSFYILNRQAGVLTISGTDKQHQLLERFLDKLETNASSQVLIEAKILEVQLNDSYQTGVDWRIFNNKLGLAFNPQAVVGTTSAGAGIGNPISFVIDKSPEDGIINGLNNPAGSAAATNVLGFLARLTEQFGTVRTLSSPRLHAMNNQIATLTFARNQVYFELSVEQNDTTSSGSTNNNTTVSSSIRTVPIGIILSLQPSINIATNEVTLSVRPTLSALVDEKDDPAVAYIAAQQGLSDLRSTVPVVQVRELDSILKLKSGQAMVIGGLMEQSGSNTDTGIPYASQVPYLGNLFKSTEKLNSNTELIIFIKATIVGSSGNSAPADRVLYDKFTDDPRPLTF